MKIICITKVKFNIALQHKISTIKNILFIIFIQNIEYTIIQMPKPSTLI